MGRGGVEPPELGSWALPTSALPPPMAMGFEPISACSTNKYFNLLN